MTTKPPADWDPSRFDGPDCYAHLSVREPKLRRASDSWRTVLATGIEPDGYYILHPQLLPRYRALELLEIKSDLGHKRARLVELKRESRARKNRPEDAQRILRQTEACLRTIAKLTNYRRAVITDGFSWLGRRELRY